MLRIANPGSDIPSFIRIYIELYEALGNYETFGLDDISKALVERNLVTSSGYMGQEALVRSYRKDRSRDRLYNQSKMYSELFKMLGWLHPLPGSALTFRFTYLGAHVVEARRDPKTIFKECILGIVYPNSILNISGNYIIRPFATILKTMAELDGRICRDELIIGPLCLEDDRSSLMFSNMLEEIKSLRGNWAQLQKNLQALSDKRRISQTTMGNYTRFPLAVLKWTGWAIAERRNDVYRRSIIFLELTDEGQKVLQTVEQSLDIRAADLVGFDNSTKEALVRLGLYEMLGRAGFDLYTVEPQILEYRQQLNDKLDLEHPLLFSPFQELDPEYIRQLFPSVSDLPRSARYQELASEAPGREVTVMRAPSGGGDLLQVQTNVPIRDNAAVKLEVSVSEKEIIDLLHNTFLETGDIVATVELIANRLEEVNKDKFYPLVAKLFRTLGYDCKHSRAGVNYERWDAFISDNECSIPIEIKSPSEEVFISVKAVRQALENKIILLARKASPTKPETTSLVVGYNLPNDRSEVVSLISDIYKAYNVVIGVIDIRSLLRLVAEALLEGKSHDPNKIIYLHGIINVADI